MRIAVLAPYESTRGAVPRIARSICRGLEASGHDVVSYPWGRRSDEESPLLKLVSRPLDAVRLGLAIRSGGFDVVLVHTGLDARTVPRDTLLLAVIGRRCARVIEIHGSREAIVGGRFSWMGRWGVGTLMNMCSGVFVLSTEEAELLQVHTTTILRVIKNPFDSGFAVLPRDQSSNEVLFVGRLVREKGILDLISAWRGVVERVEHAKLTIAGDGPARDECIRLAASLGIAETITFCGHIDGEELHELYASRGILVLPSYDEGFPTVLAEAMSYGMAIVTTEIRGARDWLVAGRNCLFVDPGKVDQLRDQISRLVREPVLASQLGGNNLNDVTMFSSDKVVAEIEDDLRMFVSHNKEASL